MSSTAGRRGFGEFKRALAPSLRDYVLRRSGRYTELDGNEIAFTIDKARLEDATFSAEALDGVCDQFRSWLWSRVAREYAKSDWKVPPRHLAVYVSVNMSDTPQETSGEERHEINPAEWEGQRG